MLLLSDLQFPMVVYYPVRRRALDRPKHRGGINFLDADVLIAVVVEPVPDVALPAEMASLIGDIFTGLSKAVSKEERVSQEFS